MRHDKFSLAGDDAQQKEKERKLREEAASSKSNSKTSGNSNELTDIYNTIMSTPIESDLSTDGVHLSEKGYDIWTKFIKPTILSMKQ